MSVAKFLVVDDDPLVRATVAATLQRAKHAVLQAGDGEQALKVLDREPVDIVVSDILMPEIDGIGLILALRKRHPQFKIIAMSGGGRTGNTDYLRMAAELGASRILPKPFTPAQLLQAVDEVLAMPPGSQAQGGGKP